MTMITLYYGPFGLVALCPGCVVGQNVIPVPAVPSEALCDGCGATRGRTPLEAFEAVCEEIESHGGEVDGRVTGLLFQIDEVRA